MNVYKISNIKKIPFNFSVTTSLILANVIVFLVFMFFRPEFVTKFVAIDPFYILQGKYLWTILTSMFMHGSLFHIFANMFSLIFVGGLIEKLIGPKRYFWFYMFSGIFGSLLYVLFYFIAGNLGINAPAVGASGALFGLVGFLVLITPNLPVYMMFIPIPVKMKYAGPGLLVVLWLISIAGNVPIGNTAHLGGLIAGIAYGVYIKTKYKRKASMIQKRFS